jgi:F0F1-type ATP synthase membrane subunit b/b'
MKRFLLALALGSSLCLAQEGAGKFEPAQDEGDPRIILKWANFAILVGILGWGLSKALPPFFKSRSEDITKGIDEAAKAKADAEAKAAAIERRLAQLGTEIEALRATAKQEMQVEADRIKRETENFLAKIHENGLAEIESASKRAQAALKAEAASQAIDLAEQKIRAGLQDGGALVERFIADLGKNGLGGKGSNN